jgi:hypothetical protein
MSNQNCGDGPAPADRPERKDTRFQPGQSGNRKGRPKGSKNKRSNNYGAQVHKVLTEPVLVNKGGKRRRIPALVAMQTALMQRALTGDNRAAEIVLKHAKDLGYGAKSEMHECICEYNLRPEVIERLTNATLQELIGIENQLQAEKENKENSNQSLH